MYSLGNFLYTAVPLVIVICENLEEFMSCISAVADMSILTSSILFSLFWWMYVYISLGYISRTGTEEGDRILKKSSTIPGPSERGIIHMGFMLGRYPGGANLIISFAFKAKSFLQEQKRKSGRFQAYEILASSLLVWWNRAPHTRRIRVTLLDFWSAEPWADNGCI